MLSSRRRPLPNAPLPTRETPYHNHCARDMAAASLSAEALAGIVSATEAAYFAGRKMRHTRAVELFSRAVEHAVAAGVPSDSLILASLRLRCGFEMFSLADETGITETSAVAMRADGWAITCEVLRVISARYRAGALLPGTIRTEEVAYAKAVRFAEMRAIRPELLHDTA